LAGVGQGAGLACIAVNTASLSAESVLWLTVPCNLLLELQPGMQDDDWLFVGMALAFSCTACAVNPRSYLANCWCLCVG
jgi:hypothetical protein